MREECCEAALAPGYLSTIAIHDRQLQCDQRGQFARFDQTDIDPAQQIKRLRTCKFRARNARYPRVDAETFYEAAPFDRFLKRSDEHTSELQSLMRITYAVFCLQKKHKHTAHTLQID